MTEQETHESPAPLWNGWALGMLFGLVALSSAFFGWMQTIHLDNRWADLSSRFQSICRDQETLQAVTDGLIEGEDGNNELRAAFSQLDPRTYPATEVEVVGVEPATYTLDGGTRMFPELVELPRYSCEKQPEPHAPSIF
jgi:hypothetical protein